MTDEKEYSVLLVNQFAYAVNGFHLYRGDRLPQKGQVITVESTLGTDPPQSRRARVTRVTPDDDFPVRAMELQSET